MRNTILVFIMMFFLQGCVDVAMTGVQVVYNRKTIENSLGDQLISIRAVRALGTDKNLVKNSNFSVATFNKEVLITGQTPFIWQKEKAEQLVKTIPDVAHVYNLVTISSPSSTLIRISDSWITAKVKAKLFASNDVDATKIKVVTENGTVYLMGILKPDEADAAVDVASETYGVQKVVKIFSYLKISKIYG